MRQKVRYVDLRRVCALASTAWWTPTRRVLTFGMNTTVHLHDSLLFRRRFRALCLVREPLVFDLTR